LLDVLFGRVEQDFDLGLMATLGLDHGEKQVLLVGKVAVERGLGHAGIAGNLVDAGAFEPFAQEDGLCTFDHLIEFAALPDLSFCIHGRPLPLATKDKPSGSVSARVSMSIISCRKRRHWRDGARHKRSGTGQSARRGIALGSG
jgi:hypothetical protein